MMPRAALTMLLIVSCAHALVHVFELSLPSVEQLIATEYYPDDDELGRAVSGWLSFSWRLPFGLGALVAGLLVDRFGARRMLTIYLYGCAAMCLLAALPLQLPMLFVAMISMGCFACIYHPAGLSLISHETTPANRPWALGIHGIFGSAGIGFAPLLAAIVLNTGASWKTYYGVLAIPGALVGTFFLVMLLRNPAADRIDHNSDRPVDDEEDATDWHSYFTLTIIALLTGTTYSAVLSFLPRYIDGAEITMAGVPRDSIKNYITSGVLLVGCIGQYAAGHFANHKTLERQLARILFSTVPFLLWMAFAEGIWRVVAAALLALVHFMHQPIYNSLIAKYTPRHRRSSCYGFSFAMGLGFGSMGALIGGYTRSPMTTYGSTALIATIAGCIAVYLSRRHTSRL